MSRTRTRTCTRRCGRAPRIYILRAIHRIMSSSDSHVSSARLLVSSIRTLASLAAVAAVPTEARAAAAAACRSMRERESVAGLYLRNASEILVGGRGSAVSRTTRRDPSAGAAAAIAVVDVPGRTTTATSIDLKHDGDGVCSSSAGARCAPASLDADGPASCCGTASPSSLSGGSRGRGNARLCARLGVSCGG